ncbi:hypothetical protein Lfu02_80460 [Longispora fulva]|nr:hypothetical protein Lfu02_80460 [Longispora fulva]
MRYTAKSIGFEENVEDDYLDVWLAEELDGTGNSLSLQCHIHEVDESEIEMGMGAYSVSTHDGITVYGAIDRVRFEGAMITFNFKPEDAEILRLDAIVEVVLDADPEVVESVRSGLRTILTWGPAESVPDMTGI